MIVDTLMSTLCSFIAFASSSTSIFNSTSKLSVPVPARIVVAVQILGFVGRIWLHRFCVPSSAHEYFVAKILLPQSCGSPCSRMSFEQQPYDNTIWLSFSWWMLMNHSSMPVWKHAIAASSNLAMSVHCVTLTCCSCHRHGKHFQCLRVCETILPFMFVYLNADKS